MATGEVWKDVVGYEGLYKVSSFGRVKSLYRKTRVVDKSGRIMRQKYDQRGYLRVNLHKDGKCKAELVSRLVARAFIPNPNNYPMVGHDDDNKVNNHVSNLYWTDAKENNHHNGKMDRFQADHIRKIDIIAASLSVPVIATDPITGDETWYSSMQAAARIGGYESGKISMVCAGKRKRHGGLCWRKDERYADCR